MEDGWIEWSAGKCPVDPEVPVDVRFRDGQVSGKTKAGFWVGTLSWWEHLSPERKHDIIAYRVVQS